jgi:hypothetical protein
METLDGFVRSCCYRVTSGVGMKIARVDRATGNVIQSGIECEER